MNTHRSFKAISIMVPRSPLLLADFFLAFWDVLLLLIIFQLPSVQNGIVALHNSWTIRKDIFVG
uniref:Uncharacterized protein n=1 Tax=Anguilla anguilla TaxID=7936 RepID=A0A0E9U6R6_ANGAN